MKELEGRMTMPTDELFAYILSETEGRIKECGRSDDEFQFRLAYVFHSVLARMAAEAAKIIFASGKCDTAALSGGVFHNTLLLGLTEKGIISGGHKVIRHHLIPPNDGGIALGQAAYGMRNIAGNNI